LVVLDDLNAYYSGGNLYHMGSEPGLDIILPQYLSFFVWWSKVNLKLQTLHKCSEKALFHRM